MPSINMNSILEKARACIDAGELQKKVEDKINSLIVNGGVVSTSGGKAITIGGASAAAAKFIEVLQNEIGSDIAISSTISLSHGSPVKVDTNRYQIDIWFSDNLHRDSLVPSRYKGVDNIVALFNNGYSAGNTVYGIWHGEEIASLKERTGMHFIDSAVRNYMANYASEYGVIDVNVNPIYK